MNLLKLSLILNFAILVSCDSRSDSFQEVEIHSEIEDIQAFYIYEDTSSHISFEKKNPIKIKFSKNGKLYDAKAKNRGGISSKYDKHSYSLKLKYDTVLFNDWEFDNDYIFNASYIDKTFIRHRFSYDLFKFFTVGNLAPNCHFKEVYLNDFYQGLFVIMEEVDNSFLGIKKTDSSSFILKDGAMFYKDKENITPQKGEDIFQQKFPKHQTNLQFKILDSLSNFIHFSSDEVFANEVSNHFDIDNIIDWHLLLLLTNNGDGVLKNFYWYKKEHQKWRVVPWDYDDSFGRNGDGTLQTNTSQWERNALLNRLFELNVNQYKLKLAKKWKEIRAKGLSEQFILEKIKNYDSELEKTSLIDNFEKWLITDKNYTDALNREEELELLIDNYNQQLLKIDSLTTIWEIQ